MKKNLLLESLFSVLLFLMGFPLLAEENGNIPNLLPEVKEQSSEAQPKLNLDEIAPAYEESEDAQEANFVGGDDYAVGADAATKTDLVQTDDKVFVLGAERVYQITPAVHYLHKPMNKEIAAIAWTNYIDVLDPQRMYFTLDDIAVFEAEKTKQIEYLKKGDFSYAINVFNVSKERIKEYKEFTEKYFDGVSADEYMAKVQSFNTSTEFLVRRKNALWPASKEARETLWDEKIQNQYLAAIVNEALKREEKAAELEKNGEPVGTNKVSTAIADIVDEEFHKSTVENILKGARRLNDVWQDFDVDTYKTYYVNAFTMSYDPHSSYFSPEKKEDFDIDMGLSLQGIGATLSIEDGMPKVVDIIPGSPADRDISENHLIPGDKIIAVAQGDEEFVDITHWPLNKAVRLIRGPKGSVVRLKVIPSTDATGTSTKLVTLVRDEIKLEEQAVSYVTKDLVDPAGNTRKLGYIKLPSFYSNAASIDNPEELRSATYDMEQAIVELKKENIEGIVLDLRGNGGGSLPEAISIAGLFIKRGPVVLVKERFRVHTLRDEDSAVAYNGPLVVLIDKLSASASEIVAGALQDYGRAIVIGDTQTHGKGTVQTVMPLSIDESMPLGAIKLTTASFYRVNGSSTQIKGVASDIVLSSVFDYISDLGEDKLPNAIPHSSVRSVSYTRVANLKETIAAVKKLSDARLALNEKWQKHLKKLNCVNAINTNDYASLNYAVRLNEERVYSQAIKDTLDKDSDEALILDATKATDSSSDEEDSVKKALEEAAKTPEQRKAEREEQKRKQRENDVVLNESYNILVDIIDSKLSTGQVEDRAQTDFDFLLNFFSPEK